jgi:excisionase family DNA binding protein
MTALAFRGRSEIPEEMSWLWTSVDVRVDVRVDIASAWCRMHTTILSTQSSNERLVYTVTEAGELLGISRAFAYELVARGELPVIRLGRRLLVPRVALLALVGLGDPVSSCEVPSAS